MILELLLHVGVLVAIVAVGVALERKLVGVDPVFAVPGWLRTLAGGVALGGPWLLYWNGYVTPVAGEFDMAATLALALVLWIAAMRLVGVGAGGARGAAC